MAGCVYPALPILLPYPCASRKDERELGRKGVVGRDEGRGREEDLCAEASIVLWCVRGESLKPRLHDCLRGKGGGDVRVVAETAQLGIQD